MNRFRNYVLMAVGFAVLVMVVGVFSAGPAIAQAVRAALVSNVDDPGRIPYRDNQSVQGDCSTPCTTGVDFKSVPAGKRLVITYVTGNVSTTAPGGTQIEFQINNPLNDGRNAARIPMIYSGSNQARLHFVFSQQVLLFYDPGTGPHALLFVGAGGQQESNASVAMFGYLLDCTATPCAAIQP